MSSALAPALIASIGGGGLLAVVVITETRRESAMRSSRVALGVTFPLDTSREAAERALTALAGLAPTVELVAEVAARGEEITHRLHLPEPLVGAVRAQLGAAVPGLRLQPESSAPDLSPVLVLGVGVRHRSALSTTDPEGAGRALLAALLPLHVRQQLVVRWALRPGHPAGDSNLTATPSMTERQRERAWQTKLAGPGLFASGLVLVEAGNVRAAEGLAARVVAVLRTRRAADDGLVIRRRWSRRGLAFPRTGRRSGWVSVGELLPLLGWPLGNDVMPGVQVGAARQVAPREALAHSGRPLLVAEHHGKPRPVALTTEAARHHALLLGSTGSGKSAVLARGILSDIAGGFGGVVLDPKGDLIGDVLDRVEPQHHERIAVIDPSDPGPIPGIDLLGSGDPDLRADVLLSVLRSLFRDAWGPRTDAYLRLGLRTLAESGGTLTDWPALFLDPARRHAAVGRLRDPLLIGQWQTFEALSEAERAQHIAAPMSRVLSLIGRPAVRAVLGQPNPRLDIGRLLQKRGWLLVSLSGGVLGAPAARLIGATVTYAAWSAIAARAAIAPELRRPVFLYFDETQALTDLGAGMGLEELLEQARGLGAGVTIATQATGRLSQSVRTSLLANVATLATFRAGADEASRIARELPGIEARDLQSLAPFEIAARVGTGRGAGSLSVTGHSEPLPPPGGQAGRIRALSAGRFGRSREEIEAAIAERYGAAEPVEIDGELGRQRRQP